jgi:hypothetical protein
MPGRGRDNPELTRMASQRGIPSWDPVSTLRGFGRAYVSFGADVWTSSLRISSFYARRALENMFAANVEGSKQELLQSFFLGLENYYIEMTTVLPFAIERLSIDEFVTGPLPSGHGGAINSTPDSRKNYQVGEKPVMLPARIGNASQGWALYFVAADRAQARLKEQDEPFTVVDVGTGRTPLVIFGIDHRESDLGTYQEIGVALIVKPQRNPFDLPGMLFLSLTVNEQFTIDAARVIWGYQKSLAKNMTVRYNSNSAIFCVDERDPTAFSVSFPRFGRSRSTNVPCYIYSVPVIEKNGIPHRTVLSRSAVDEGIQISGAVQLQFGNGCQKNCGCRLDLGAGKICICSMLSDLGLPEKPAANGWAQLMSGSFGPPSPCE